MVITKTTQSVTVLLLVVLMLGTGALAQSTNEKVVTDFQNGMQQAQMYYEVILSEIGEPLGIVLTVYEEPVVLNYLYDSIDEVDITKDESVLLSRISEGALAWYELNRDIVVPKEHREMISDGLFRFSVMNRNKRTENVVGYNRTEFLSTDYNEEFSVSRSSIKLNRTSKNYEQWLAQVQIDADKYMKAMEIEVELAKQKLEVADDATKD